jgi:Asp/Glu/hydantoin racemase
MNRNKRKKISIIETTLVPLQDLRELFFEIIPDAEIISFVDDSLLKEVISAGKPTPDVIRRYCSYAVNAESIGSDLIFNQCSSVGEVVDIAQKMVNIPIFKTDLPMAKEAVEKGTKIGVVATLNTTLNPTSRLIQKVADEKGGKITIIPKLAEGAFDLVSKGDKEGHNKLVIKTIQELANSVDVIALAQGSMAVLIPDLKGVDIPVLSSPKSGVLGAKAFLEKL